LPERRQSDHSDDILRRTPEEEEEILGGVVELERFNRERSWRRKRSGGMIS
jgi:hypothetical protein